jgi:outer membrane murein-binding lipoprotein Lpp
LDQVLAKRIGDATALSSLVLACERPISGFHESGNSMMYASHVSWSSPVSPVPAEMYPALAFDSLFESKGNRAHVSVLDHVREQLRDVTRRVSRSDQAKIEEYASSVREVEGRLSRLQANDKDAANDAIKAKRPPNGLPTQLDVHARLMCDIVALAFQADRTRIATMLLTNNLSGQVYPFLGFRDDHHSYSHRWQNKEFAAISRFWVEQYGYLVGKLAATQEGDGTVLDNSCIMLANEQWVAHSAEKVPLLMAGGLGGSFATGRSLDFEKSQNRKFSSLLMTLSDRMGLKLDSFGDSTEQLEI